MEYLLVNSNGKKEQGIYPDFISKDKNIIADAKYEHLKDKNREDYFQLIAYVYRFGAKTGFLLYPKDEDSILANYIIKATEGRLIKLCLAIPNQCNDYKSFCIEIEANENDLKKKMEECVK